MSLQKTTNQTKITAKFQKAIKQLLKKHKYDVVLQIVTLISKLEKFEISGQSSNHPLKNAQGFRDIHLDGGNLILLYKYENNNLVIDLLLKDIVTHKQLKRYNFKQKDTIKPISSIQQALDELNNEQ